MKEVYDLVIIGGGAAGLSAAVYSLRQMMKTLVISKSLGGTVMEAHFVENWLGFKGTGAELGEKFFKHAESMGAKIVEAEAKKIEKKGNLFFVQTDNGAFEGKSIILATGMEHRKLNVPGEEDFLGNGVSYCYTCDGLLFKGKNVAVIGGANSSCSGALYLSGIAKKVYIIYRKENLRADKSLVEKIKKTSNIEVITKANVAEIKGENVVDSVNLDIGKELKVDGVFIEAGLIPLTGIAKELGVNANEEGFILSDDYRKTNIPGVFVAGDVCANNVIKQLIIAASDGAVAALSAYNYIQKME